jgi:glyoxylase-like metal-dependent hydrolase (beta-lactamase superfamily II)
VNNNAIHIEIEPQVHLIRGSNRARFPKANSLLIDDEILTLVDAGSDLIHIEKTLSDLGHSLKDLDRIVLSHFHTDHKGHANKIQDISSCEVLCHPLAEHGVLTFDGLAENAGMLNHRLYDEWKELIAIRLPYAQGNYAIDGYFKDEKPIDCGNIQLLPLHTPGHTHDHTCFGINGYEKVLLVDIDLTRFGPWYANIVSDIEQFKTSIRQIIELQPKMGISSHLLDPVTDELETRLIQYLEVFDKRDERILDQIAQGVDTLEKLTMLPTIYPTIPYRVYFAFEEWMLSKHIDLLIKSDQLIQENGRLLIERT